MTDGFFRVASAIPAVQPADVEANTLSIIGMIDDLAARKAELVVFPETCITGYTCGDLFHNSTLIDSVGESVRKICAATSREDSPLVIVGAPYVVGGVMYNCAFAIRGRVHAVIPKTYIPNYNEFYEKRWWTSAPDRQMSCVAPDGREVPFGVATLLEIDGVKIGVEICEDLWTPVPPSCNAAMAGAQVIVNLSASDDLIGKYT